MQNMIEYDEATSIPSITHPNDLSVVDSLLEVGFIPSMRKTKVLRRVLKPSSNGDPDGGDGGGDSDDDDDDDFLSDNDDDDEEEKHVSDVEKDEYYQFMLGEKASHKQKLAQWRALLLVTRAYITCLEYTKSYQSFYHKNLATQARQSSRKVAETNEVSMPFLTLVTTYCIHTHMPFFRGHHHTTICYTFKSH